MSIINEALKKVQSTRLSPEPRAETDAVSPPSAPFPGERPLSKPDQPLPVRTMPKGLQFSSRFLIAAPVAILILLFVLQVLKQLPLGPGAQKASPSSTKIIVNGIVTMENKKMALINNEIYEIGDMIDGMTLMSIATDSIQLLKEGKIQIYKVHK